MFNSLQSSIILPKAILGLLDRTPPFIFSAVLSMIKTDESGIILFLNYGFTALTNMQI